MSRKFETHVRDSGLYAKSPSGPCCACDKPTTHWVRVAFTYMRGEDDFFDVCHRHRDMAAEPTQMSRFFAHVRTKERFLQAKAEGAK